MQQAERPLLAEIRYGRDADHLYFAFVPGVGGFAPGTRLAVGLASPGFASLAPSIGDQPNPSPGPEAALELVADIGGEGGVTARIGRRAGEEWAEVQPVERATLGEILEVALPLAILGPTVGASVTLVVTVTRDGSPAERLPRDGSIDWELGV